MSKLRFEMHTKRPAQYFSGVILQSYCPKIDGTGYFVCCESLAGGGRKVSIATVIDWQEKTKKRLVEKIKSFARSQKYVLKWSK